jgi:hypothetical protein
VVDAFVAQITELARRAALNTLEATFASHGAGRASTVAPPRGAAPVGRPRGGRGAKRTAEDLEALSSKFASFVKSHPGLRIEQINKELGTTTKDLARCALEHPVVSRPDLHGRVSFWRSRQLPEAMIGRPAT